MQIKKGEPRDEEGKGTTAPDAPAASSANRRVPISVMDKRRVSKDGEGREASEPSTRPLYVEQLEGRVKRVEAAFEERVRGLEEETRKSRERLLGDLERRYQEKEHALMLEVLGLLDDLDRARSLTSPVPAVAEGLAVISARADQFLRKHGLQSVWPEGEPFDPERMEAVATQPGPEGRVVAVVEPGYLQGEFMLRPSRVIVGCGEGDGS